MKTDLLTLLRRVGANASPRRHSGTLKALLGGVTLADAADRLAQVRGAEVAVTLAEPLGMRGFDRRRWSYADIGRFVGTACGALRERGLGPGQRVVVCTSNRLDMPLYCLAAARAGAVAVPLNHKLSADELRYILDDSGARACVTDAEVYERVVEPALDRFGEIEFHIAAAPGACAHVGPTLWETMAKATAGEPEMRDPDEVAAIFYTSGTTGFPKGAMLTGRGMLSRFVPLLARPVYLPRTLLCALPMAHIMGFVTLLASLFSGTHVVYLSRFRADEVTRWLASGEVDAFLGVPSMYQMLEEAGALERDLSGVKVFASAADVMPGELMQRFKNAGRLVRLPRGRGVPALFVEAYGSVELSGAAMLRISPPFLSPMQGGFVGWPLPGYSVRIVSETGVEVAAGEVGELMITGPGVLQGYHGRDEATQDTIREGWLRTGDLASRGRARSVKFVGRHKDVIKSGGYSVFPAEIETKLLQHEAVSKAAVVGVPHPTKRAVPVAIVCVEPGAAVSAEELRDWISGRVARYKAPRLVLIIDEDEMPYGATGKILKRQLAERYADATKG
jgi:acyl-CoA synthetase (AMP-forming)/AMP-acid ligase II